MNIDDTLITVPRNRHSVKLIKITTDGILSKRGQALVELSQEGKIIVCEFFSKFGDCDYGDKCIKIHKDPYK